MSAPRAPATVRTRAPADPPFRRGAPAPSGRCPHCAHPPL